ncbi:MAG: Tfx family DNA-binding protein [Methanobacteriota archaeon]|uniref:Tfx family DNA-binding protein n=1 Tax=Halorutilus salinus TaxID=2487751 RepID=A0A9Q4GH54_9EURY|nr:Tfx family DNA-binding protein [Halorutilus salinus]
MELPDTDGTFLTERQARVLSMRHEGMTQREIADDFGTTTANVSMIESTAEENVKKARRTVELAKRIRTPDRVQVSTGDHIDEVVETVYDVGDVRGVSIGYSRPELYTHIYTTLSDLFDGERFNGSVEIGVTDDGEVEFYR